MANVKKNKKDVLAGKKDKSLSLLKDQERPTAAGRIRSVILLGMTLAAITLAVYWQVKDHEFLTLDDNVYITENSHVLTGLTVPNVIWAFTSIDRSNYWHPITWLTHQADVQLYGMNPRGHHLTNVGIHVLAALILFAVLFRLTGCLWQSAFVAALFALHPLHVESVAWVAERKDVLSALFSFLTLLFYAEYAVKQKPFFYWLAFFSFMLGLMSKPMVVTLPAVMLLMDIWPLNRYSLTRLKSGEPYKPFLPLAKEKIPFFAGSILATAVTIYGGQKAGMVPFLKDISFWSRLENAITDYGKYIMGMFWPHDMAVFYPPAPIPLWQVTGTLLVLLFVSAATIRFWRRYPYLAVGWFWFIITLLPVIGLIQVGYFPIADRYTYLPLIGLFIMIAWGIPALVKNLPYGNYILSSLAVAAVAAAATVTWQQIGYWRENVSLYRHALSVTSGNYVMHCSLGLALVNQGDLDEAIKEYRLALALKPDYVDVYYNLGNVFVRKGDLDEAIRNYREALRIKPSFSLALNNWGNALAHRGDLDGAINKYREAIAIHPDYFEAHYNMANVFTKQGNLDEAIQEYRTTLMIHPNFVAADKKLELVLEIKGNR